MGPGLEEVGDVANSEAGLQHPLQEAHEDITPAVFVVRQQTAVQPTKRTRHWEELQGWGGAQHRAGFQQSCPTQKPKRDISTEEQKTTWTRGRWQGCPCTPSPSARRPVGDAAPVRVTHGQDAGPPTADQVLGQVSQGLAHCSPKQDCPQHLVDISHVAVKVGVGIEAVCVHGVGSLAEARMMVAEMVTPAMSPWVRVSGW